jgi:hypothetical protein
MFNKLFLIDYESSQWCGGSSHCVVRAEDADAAVILAEEHMETEMRELFSDEYGDDGEADDSCDDECAYTVNSVEEFDESHEYWKYFIDPDQSQFFPLVN